jgi:putative Mn2+ efflux pump MntP
MQSALLCSLDSLFASLGMGLLGCSDAIRRRLILAFTICDLTASFAGASLHFALPQIYRQGLHPFFIPLLLVVLASAALSFSRNRPSVYLCIPILLGLDNFLSGLLDGFGHLVQSPLIAGLFSALLAWLGFALARPATHLLSRRGALVASLCLIFLAFIYLN